MEESIPTHSRRAWVGRCGGRPRPRGRLRGPTTHPSTFGGMARSWPKSRNHAVVPHSALRTGPTDPPEPAHSSLITRYSSLGEWASHAFSHRLFSDGHQP